MKKLIIILFIPLVFVLSCSQLQSQQTNQYDDKGNKVGLWKSYYDTGELEEESYWVDGKQTGVFKTYYKNGNLQMEANAKQNNIDGPIKYYFENGRLKATGTFKDNKRVGLWIEYNVKGEIIQKKEFTSDREW